MKTKTLTTKTGCTGHGHLILNARSPRGNPLKRDPTRTTMLRKKFESDMRKRLASVKRAITHVVVELDAFHLKSNTGGNPFANNELTVNKPFKFRSYGMPDTGVDVTLTGVSNANFLADPNAIFAASSPSGQLTAYQAWFKEQVDAGLLSVAPGYEDVPWTSPYVDSAYKKGVVRGYNDAKGLANVEGPFGQGSQAQFLESAFAGPVGTRQLQLLGTRAFQQLQGVTAAMEQQMSRVLADGLAHGLGPREIARTLNKTVTELGRKRALVIARTEVINAYAEGQLDSFDQLNVSEVGVMAEWSTSGDDRVCPMCNDLTGVVLTVKEARGMLPRHPNCRCAWLPAMVGETAKGRKTSQQQIKSSIDKSAAKQKGEWRGSEKTIAKDRTKTPGFNPATVGGKQVAGKGLGSQAPAATLWNHQPTAVLRWMGSEGFTVEEAAAVMEATGTPVAEATIKTQVRAGAVGKRGAIASLTEEQGAALRALRTGTVPEFPQANTSIIRWMGREGFTFEEAQLALKEAGLEVAESTLKTQLGAGRKGLRGAPAELTEVQQKWLMSKKTTPGGPPKPTPKKPEVVKKPTPKPEVKKPEVVKKPIAPKLDPIPGDLEDFGKYWNQQTLTPRDEIIAYLDMEGFTTKEMVSLFDEMGIKMTFKDGSLVPAEALEEFIVGRAKMMKGFNKHIQMRQSFTHEQQTWIRTRAANPRSGTGYKEIIDDYAPLKKTGPGPAGINIEGAAVDDPFVKKIWKEIGDEGLKDSDHVVRVGQMVDDQIMKNNPKLKRMRKELDDDMVEWKKTQDLIERYESGELKSYPQSFWEERRIWNEKSKEFADLYAEQVLVELKKVRSVGGNAGNIEMGGSKAIKNKVIKVQGEFPTDWNDLLTDHLFMDVKKIKRGHCSIYRKTTGKRRGVKKTEVKTQHQNRSTLKRTGDTKDVRVMPGKRFSTKNDYYVTTDKSVCELRVSDAGSKARGGGRTHSKKKTHAVESTTAHELGHALEYVTGESLVKLEADFLRMRYLRSANKRISKVDGIYQIEDDFFQYYSGKMYPTRNGKMVKYAKETDEAFADRVFKTYFDDVAFADAGLAENWEVFQMSIESVLHGTDRLVLVDPEHANFAMGILFGL